MGWTIQLLNELLAIHSNSLPTYLMNAKPWSSQRDERAMEALKLIATDHRRMADRIGSLILSMNGSVRKCAFPMAFTDLHDLSSDYILQEVRRRQREDTDRIAEIAEQLGDDPKARAVAREALGAARGHLQNLDELMSSLSA